MTLFLFVYASLRSGFRNPSYAYISQFFEPAGEATVKGSFFFNGKYPVAISAGNDDIQGELYKLKDPRDFNWAIGQLDDYEGLNVEDGETPLYQREITTVIQNGKPVQAWVYWYNKPVDGMISIPAAEVMRYLPDFKNRG